jgi:hypothetical protein
VFADIAEPPVASPIADSGAREASPIVQSAHDLRCQHDIDPFNRWQAVRRWR